MATSKTQRYQARALAYRLLGRGYHPLVVAERVCVWLGIPYEDAERLTFYTVAVRKRTERPNSQ